MHKSILLQCFVVVNPRGEWCPTDRPTTPNHTKDNGCEWKPFWLSQTVCTLSWVSSHALERRTYEYLRNPVVAQNDLREPPTISTVPFYLRWKRCKAETCLCIAKKLEVMVSRHIIHCHCLNTNCNWTQLQLLLLIMNNIRCRLMNKNVLQVRMDQEKPHL